MSKPIFSDLFKFSGRRNRQSFIFLQLISLATVLLGIGVITAITIAAPAVGTVLLFLGIAGFIAIAVANWAAASQRVRDFGQSGVWSLVMLIPYVGPVFSIALWIIPSSEGENKYGPSQTASSVVTA